MNKEKTVTCPRCGMVTRVNITSLKLMAEITKLPYPRSSARCACGETLYTLSAKGE